MRTSLRRLLPFAVAFLAFAVACATPASAPPSKYGVGPATNLPVGQVLALTGNIYVDPANASGCATDKNATCSLSTCGTAGDGPCKTYAQVAQRWGTYAPRISASTTLTWISSQPDNTDPIYLRPYIEKGAQFTIACALGAAQQIGTGTLASFTAKNRSTPQLTQAALGFTASADQLVRNATHASSAWTYGLVSGTTWKFSQPLTIGTFTLNGTTEVNTWATSDAVTVYEPIAIDLVELLPEIAHSTSTTQLVKVQNCTVLDPAGIAQDPVYVNALVAFSESKLQRSLVDLSPTSQSATVFPQPSATTNGLYNSVSLGNNSVYQLYNNGSNGVFAFVGGIDQSNASNGAYYGWTYFDSDPILDNFPTFYRGGGLNGIYTGSGFGITVEGFTFEPGTLWGAGSLTVVSSRSSYTASTATATFLNTGGIFFTGAGATTACSTSGSTTQIIICGITVNVANLDAAAGASGFGGRAFQLGGPALVKGFP